MISYKYIKCLKVLLILQVLFLTAYNYIYCDIASAVEIPVEGPEGYQNFPKNIISDFGPRIASTIIHYGIDFKCDWGEPVRSLTDGVLVQTTYSDATGLGGYGFAVVVKSGDFKYD